VNNSEVGGGCEVAAEGPYYGEVYLYLYYFEELRQSKLYPAMCNPEKHLFYHSLEFLNFLLFLPKMTHWEKSVAYVKLLFCHQS